MATSAEDLEAYLQRLDRRFEKASEHTYLVSLGADKPPAVVRVAPPVVVVQVDVAPAPAGNLALEARLFRRLLELNATDLLHVSYGIDKGRIQLDAALELATLDIGELEAVLANIDLAVTEHVPVLHDIVKKGGGATASS
jgi:hypothetical protein